MTSRGWQRIVWTVVACLFTLSAALGGSPRVAVDEALQAKVMMVMRGRPGAVIVYDIDHREVRAVTDATLVFRTLRPPGSLMKLVSALALYDARARVVPCADRYSVGGRGLTCGFEGGHGRVDLREAIARSCCVWFHAVGASLDVAALFDAARRCGIGVPSPFPAGASARLRAPRTAAERALARVGEGGWVQITPWDAVSLVVSLREARDPAGSFVYAAMRDTVTHGTARAACVDGIDVRGKTGTATWLEPARADAAPRTHGWFAGTAGRLAIVVFLQQGTGRDAAAIAGRVLRQCRESL